MSDIVDGVGEDTIEEVDIPDFAPFDDVIDDDGGVDVQEILHLGFLVEIGLRQKRHSSFDEVIPEEIFVPHFPSRRSSGQTIFHEGKGIDGELNIPSGKKSSILAGK